MAEITTQSGPAGIIIATATATSSSCVITRSKNATATGIAGHSEIAGNCPKGIKLSNSSGQASGSMHPVMVRVFPGTTATAATDAATAQFVIDPAADIIVPAGPESNLLRAGGTVYAASVVCLTSAGQASVTVEWVD